MADDNSNTQSNIQSNIQSNTLAGILIFSDLEEKDRHGLEKTCRWRDFSPREQVFDPHGDSQSVFFLVSGRVRVVDFSVLGQEVTFDDLYEGAHFGEMSAIDGCSRSAGVVAVTNSKIASMSAENFKDIIVKHPSVAFKVMSELSRIVRSADARIMDLSTLGANNRVCAEVLRQAMDAIEKEHTTTIRPIPIHGEIASRVSTTRETVARAMSELARQGIVERTKDSLLIHDLDRLKEMVEAVRGEDRRTSEDRRRDSSRQSATDRRRGTGRQTA